jgi:hypothetical protein
MTMRARSAAERERAGDPVDVLDRRCDQLRLDQRHHDVIVGRVVTAERLLTDGAAGAGG